MLIKRKLSGLGTYSRENPSPAQFRYRPSLPCLSGGRPKNYIKKKRKGETLERQLIETFKESALFGGVVMPLATT
ncbi:hypothetical protein TH63_10985 [Rufibacter radiotolerans]|uniref:Uncharacterized protein n=1 Tax=Rufibacter radiotolerans TaxID=1379910 RepID=A0A0H4VJR7_9BACT|nr:hypothetical protein TH63_10985 [Rufibacter radiotolerans]